MKFRTEIEIEPFPPEARIGYGNRMLAVGSCFAEEMTARLRRLGFACTVNPSGVLFNPASVAAALRSYDADEPVGREELHEQDELRFHFGFHSSFAAADADEALARMNAARRAGAEALRKADRVLVTFGTAWVYEREGRIVANCHRRPASEFVRRRLSVGEIVADYDELLHTTLAGKQVLLTVSPVRHTADGLTGNCASKAVLRLAAEELAGRHDRIRYFPAYEILTDDLRDYRFYADDLVHPAPQAVEYVWEKFSAAVLSEQARRLLPDVRHIVVAAAHRPRNPQSATYREFCRRRLEEIAALPQIDFRTEAEYFRRCIEINS